MEAGQGREQGCGRAGRRTTAGDAGHREVGLQLVVPFFPGRVNIVAAGAFGVGTTLSAS